MGIMWKQLNKNNFLRIKKFILAHEIHMIPVAETMREGEVKRKYDAHFLVAAFIDTKVIAILCITNFGTLIPYWNTQHTYLIMRSIHTQSNIKKKLMSVSAIIGNQTTTKHISQMMRNNIAPTKQHRCVEYLFMVLSKPNLNNTWKKNIKPDQAYIQRAYSQDIENILPLHNRYLQEEVQINKDGTIVNARYAFAHLKNSLARHTYYIAWHNAQAIAKANTNAEGYACAQLGGIFTQQRYRKLGIAYQCTVTLCESLFSRYTDLALFVKIQNKSAISLYDTIGFRMHSNYSIHYFS